MAVKHTPQDGSYSKTVEDSSHQDKKKFGNINGKTTDNLPKPSQKANDTKYSGKHHPNP